MILNETVKLILLIFATITPIVIVAIIITEVETLENKHRVKSKKVYDLLKTLLNENLKEKSPYDIYYIYLGSIEINKLSSIFFPYYICNLGYIGRWSKSGRLLKSLWLTKRETLALRRKNQIDKFWDKQKNKQ